MPAIVRTVPLPYSLPLPIRRIFLALKDRPLAQQLAAADWVEAFTRLSPSGVEFYRALYRSEAVRRRVSQRPPLWLVRPQTPAGG